MRSWVLDRYGPPEGLALRQVALPAIRDDRELLVRVLASSINAADRHMLSPPFLFRRGRGFLRPKSGAVGLDFAGRVEAVGRAVREYRVGDAVFGIATGAYGEFAIADEREIARKPTRLTFEEAAAIPIAAVTALQGLRDRAAVRPGQRVLINGASGGVGTFAVQIAKALGAEVSVVCGPGSAEVVRSLGVQRLYDYSREDFARSGERYDVVCDTQLNHSLADYRRVLNPGGLLLVVGAGPGNASRLLRRLIRTIIGARIVGPKLKFFIASVKSPDLAAIASLVDGGQVTPVIDRKYPLEEVPAALRYLMQGHARGKIVVTISADPTAAAA